MSATAADLRSLIANLTRIYPGYSRELMQRARRLEAFLTLQAEQLDRQREREELVLRPVGDAWEVGYARSPIIVTPTRARLRALQAAHRAISQPGCSIDLVEFVDPSAPSSCVVAANATRNALRDRVVPWIVKKTWCTPLADVVARVQILNEGFAIYDPELHGESIPPTIICQ